MAADAVLEPLTEDELLALGPLIEGQTRVVVPKKGKVFEDDGTCKIAIMRPCVSRGKRLRGLPPIYTPEMLAENAAVFSGWLMYMDHLTEAIIEAVRKRGRSINELGGRVLESYFDPQFRLPDDDDYGYRPGAVIGKALPQPGVRAMLEADPEIIHVSINAYPKGVKEGVAPWNPTLKGMLVEGIRKQPQGSVDWVPRGGAGGRVLVEVEQAAVSILNSYYDADELMPNWKNMTAEQLRESLREENPELLREIAGTPAPSTTPTTPPVLSLTREDVERLLEAQRADFEAKLEEERAGHEARIAELEGKLQEAVDERIEERDEYRDLEKVAHRQIKAAGLPPRWTEDILRRYSVLPSGPSPALLVEASEDKTVEEVLQEAVKEDVEHARELIAESGGRPRVRHLGGGRPSEGESNGSGGGSRQSNAFREFLSEGWQGEEPPKDEDIKKLVQEGVR